MKIILESPRLLLREFSRDDYFHFFDLNNDPEVVKYVGDGAFASLNAAKKFVDNYDHYEKFGMGRWAVILKSGDQFTGWCGLKFQPELSATGEVDLGYRFFRKFWGQKIASESAQACVDYGFNTLGLKRIIGRVMVGNVASAKVLEKCGMHFVKEMHFDEHPGLYYEIENPNWKEDTALTVDENFCKELERLAASEKKCSITYKNEIGVRLKTESIIKTFFSDGRKYIELRDGKSIFLNRIISVDGKTPSATT